ncbi:MAG TPA: hypothetical protein VF134_04865 [Candidatus Dormibacteraeota bacterium]
MNVLLVGGVTFLAAAVEWVEALTIVLAVGLFKGWRSAFAGIVLALVALVALVAVFGVAVTKFIPIDVARGVVGVFLLLFGLKWLHKAILRSAGLVALHDEAKAFEKEKEYLLEHGGEVKQGLDPVGTLTSFNGVFLEGLEVVFIVIALGGLRDINSAAAGALVSLVVVAAVGVIFRAPLTRVPENAMKYVVGVMLTAFGTFFAGEGLGVSWWHDDVSILFLIATYLVVSLVLVQILKIQPSAQASARRQSGLERFVRAAALEVWGLFIGDSALALVVVIALLAVGLYTAKVQGGGGAAQVFVVAGILLAVIVGLVEPWRRRARAARAAQPAPTVAPAKDAVPAGAHRQPLP